MAKTKKKRARSKKKSRRGPARRPVPAPSAHPEKSPPISLEPRGKPLVLFVGSRWCDGNPEFGPTNAEHNLWGSLQASGLAGQERFHFDEFHTRYRRKGDSPFLDLCRERRPDLVFLDWLNGSPLNPSLETLAQVREMGIPLVTVWWDMVWDQHIQSAEALAPLASFQVVLDSAAFYPRVKVPAKYLFLWSPQDPRLFFDPHGERDLPVSFMGRLSKLGRREILAALQEAGVEVYHSGGQRENRVSIEEYASIYRRSEMVLNFSASPSGHTQVVGRVLEVLLSGALLLEEDNVETRGLFVPMEDYVPFTGPFDLAEKIRYFRDHSDEGRAIAACGAAKARRLYGHEVFWRTVLENALGKEAA